MNNPFTASSYLTEALEARRRTDDYERRLAEDTRRAQQSKLTRHLQEQEDGIAVQLLAGMLARPSTDMTADSVLVQRAYLLAQEVVRQGQRELTAKLKKAGA